jgi:hypothetical protein
MFSFLPQSILSPHEDSLETFINPLAACNILKIHFSTTLFLKAFKICHHWHLGLAR